MPELELALRMGESYGSIVDGIHKGTFVLVEGRRGTGKTRSILTHIVSQAISFPKSRWLVCRSTRTRLTQTIMATLEEEVFPLFQIKYPIGSREHRNEYRIFDSTIIVQGMDDMQRTQSSGVAGIYVAEGVELDQAEDVEALAGALRQDIEGLEIRQCLVDCNPGPPAHWLNKIAEEVPPGIRRIETFDDYMRLQEHNIRPVTGAKWKRIITCHQDNPGYFDSDKWEWTQLGQQYLTGLGTLSGHLRQRWLNGEWAAAAGSIFPEFDESIHIVEPFEIPNDWPTIFLWDPGVDHPTAILWITAAPTGCLYIVDEIYEGGRSVTEHCAKVKLKCSGRNIVRGYADPQQAFSETASSISTIAEQAAKCGLRLSPWPRTGNNELGMIEDVRDRLKSGMLRVFSHCRGTISEFQSWMWSKKRDGSIRDGDDKPEDKNNDAMDCVKGAIATGFSFNNHTISVGGSVTVATQKQRQNNDERIEKRTYVTSV